MLNNCVFPKRQTGNIKSLEMKFLQKSNVQPRYGPAFKNTLFFLFNASRCICFSVFLFSPLHSSPRLFSGILSAVHTALRYSTKLSHTPLLMLKVYFCYRCNNKRPFKSDLKIFRRNWLQHWGVEVLILASGSVQEKMDRFLWNALCVRI